MQMVRRRHQAAPTARQSELELGEAGDVGLGGTRISEQDEDATEGLLLQLHQAAPRPCCFQEERQVGSERRRDAAATGGNAWKEMERHM